MREFRVFSAADEEEDDGVHVLPARPVGFFLLHPAASCEAAGMHGAHLGPWECVPSRGRCAPHLRRAPRVSACTISGPERRSGMEPETVVALYR